MRKVIGAVLFIILISFSILEIRKNHESSETQMEIERAKEMSDIKANMFNAYNNKVICQSINTSGKNSIKGNEVAVITACRSSIQNEIV